MVGRQLLGNTRRVWTRRPPPTHKVLRLHVSGFKPVMRSSEKIGRLGRATQCCLAANAAEKQQRQCNNDFFRSGIIAAWLAGVVYF